VDLGAAKTAATPGAGGGGLEHQHRLDTLVEARNASQQINQKFVAPHLSAYYHNAKRGMNLMLNRIVALALGAFLAVATTGAHAQGRAYYYVANTTPPDAFLALKSYPSPRSPRLMAMANGTKLEVLLRRVDGWWYVKVSPTGEEGWAFQGSNNKAYILCCTAGEGPAAEPGPPAKDIADFTCEQLWFGRNSIFKEAGYCFKTSRAISAFGNAGCQYDDITLVPLSAENQSFAAAIQRAEQMKACPR
jgi:hypothetical protein